MKKLLLSFALIASIGLISACSNEKQQLKSPCVGASGSPCDWHKPINNA